MARESNETWEWIKALLIALLLAGAVRYFVFAPIVVYGESMMPTLHHNDRLIVNKLNYAIGNPERYEIIVFKTSENRDYIKRIIGLPGDTIEYKDDVLLINGEEMPEAYLNELRQMMDNELLTYDFTLREVTGEKTVPEGHLFVLGDNRRHSKDSRNIGTVPMEDVIGEAQLRFWPISDINLFNQ
jgi:signal peptidase I